MKPYDETRFKQDESGQWWYYYGADLKIRSRVLPRVCGWCQQEFLPTIRTRKDRPTYCSKSCGQFQNYSINPERAKGENGGNWKGGRRLDHRGYVLINCPDHPSLQGKLRRVMFEHRLVMEKMLGRLLTPEDNVHHKNGVRDDNRPENLELWEKAQPVGVRANQKMHCPTCMCFDCD